MVGKITLGITVLAVAFQVLLAPLSRFGLLGGGDTEFLRYGCGTAIAALIATVAAIGAVVLASSRQMNAWMAIGTVILALFSIISVLRFFFA